MESSGFYELIHNNTVNKLCLCSYPDRDAEPLEIQIKHMMNQRHGALSLMILNRECPWMDGLEEKLKSSISLQYNTSSEMMK